ncbi:MAG: ABC transporter permease, partial [Gemmatimonadaceae bacterium]
GDRRAVQRGLVVLQVALAFVLLTASALMARTFVALRQVPLGFDAAHALMFKTALPPATYAGAADVVRFLDRLTQQLARLPGVQTVGVTDLLPLEQTAGSLGAVWAEGDESPQREIPPARPLVTVSSDYFRALGIPLLSGRAFRDEPLERTPNEVVVSAAFARQMWGERGEQEALGRRVRLLPDAPWLTVVGVVGSIRDAGLGREPSPIVYLPIGFDRGLDTAVPRVARVVVRTAGEPITLAAAARREVAALDATLPVYDLQPMEQLVRRSMARTSFTALLLAIAAGVALALGAIGLYGIVAYTVGMRRREIGLRIALGSPPAVVSRLLLRQGAVLAALGVGVGLVAALAVTRVLEALLYGVSPTSPVVLASAAALLLVVVLGASWIPAWRASRVDPASVLSAE